MTFDLGPSALLAVLAVCGTVITWRWLTLAMLRAAGSAVLHSHHDSEEEDRYDWE